ncbi:MAG: branched-chain amino acid ABC transporter permease [Nevskiales bacterium]
MSAASPLARSYRQNIIGLFVLGAIILAAGLLVAGSYPKTMLIFSMINAVAAIGLCLLFGYGGQISLCQGGLLGLGAYTAADLVQKLGVDPLLALAGSAILPAVFGWLVARPLLRLSSHYLAMATLALGLILSIFYAQLVFLTGGADTGISELARFAPLGLPLGTTNAMFWVSGVALVLAMAVAVNLIHSRVGRALRAIRSAEIPASSLGIDTVRYKVAIFSLAAGMAGLAGGLYAFFTRAFNSSGFEVGLSIDLLITVLVGSVRNPWGAVVGAFVITILPAFLEGFDRYRLFSYGVLMTAIMIFMPDGLVSAGIDWARSLLRRRAS